LLELIHNYQGNPLWLKIIATTIKELFNGKISDLLKYDPLFLSEELDYLLCQQFNLLSDIEKQIMYVIASEPNFISMSKLLERTQLLPSDLLNAVQSLGRRSLIEKSLGEFINFGLQPIVKQYVKNQYTHTLK